MWQMILEELRGTGIWGVIFKSVLSIFCGGAIGLEREMNKQAAGFRTHIVVCMGACIAMLTGQYITENVSASSDVARMGAQVISGIGFLGAGTIISTDVSHRVRGLTTAAGLWAAACIGLAVGIGYYEAAVMGTAAVFSVMVMFKKLDRLFYTRSSTQMVYLEMDGMEHVRNLMNVLRENNLSFSSVEVCKPKSGMKGSVGVSLVIKKKNHGDRTNIADIINTVPGLIFMESPL